MQIVILCYKDVADYYTAALLQRGHTVVQHGGGAIHAPAVKAYIECDGCLLLGDDPDLREIADYMEASGKPIWRQLTDIPCVDGILLARVFWLVTACWSVAPMCPAFLLGANTDGLHAIRKIGSRSKARARGALGWMGFADLGGRPLIA